MGRDLLILPPTEELAAKLATGTCHRMPVGVGGSGHDSADGFSKLPRRDPLPSRADDVISGNRSRHRPRWCWTGRRPCWTTAVRAEEGDDAPSDSGQTQMDVRE